MIAEGSRRDGCVSESEKQLVHFMGYSEEASTKKVIARREYRSCRTMYTAIAASRVNISDPRKRLAHRVLLVFDISAW